MLALRIIILTFPVFLMSSLLGAQTRVDDFQLKVYGFEEQLTHRNIFKIRQDTWGFIWIATINGLNRFDGRKMIHFTKTKTNGAFPGDFISDLVISSDSLIWMSIGNELVQMDPRTKAVETKKLSLKSVLKGERLSFNSLYIDSDNQLWMMTYLEQTGESFLQRLNHDKIEDVAKCKGQYAKRGLIEYNGQYFFSHQSNQIRAIERNGKLFKDYNLVNPYHLNDEGWVVNMHKTDNGTLWVLMNTGLIYFMKKGEDTFQIHPISRRLFGNNIYSALYVEENGNVWVGGMGALWFYDHDTDRLLNYNERVKGILKHTCNFRDIFKDETGVIWLSSDFGMIKVTRTGKLFTTYLSEGNEYCNDGACSLRGITEDEFGNIYFSYYNSIHVLEKTTGLLRPLFSELTFKNPPFGLLYHQNALWTWNGKKIDLNELTTKDIITNQKSELGALMLGPENNIWFGCENKICVHDPLSETTQSMDLKNEILDTSNIEISHLSYNQKKQNIWLSTVKSGVYELDPVKGAIQHFSTDSLSNPTLLHNRINAAYEDVFNQLWLATAKGLHRIDLKTKALKVYTTEDGLANDFINAIISEGDSVIWATTDNGLSRLSVDTETCINFHKEDGIAANEFNRMSFYKASDGRIFFGGIHGATAFYPGKQFLKQRQKAEGKVMLTSFSKLDGENDSLIYYNNGFSKDKTITLSHNDRFFTFEFSLANYKNPLDNIFSYRLDPYESEWSDPSNSTIARYGIIPAGNYIFRVRSKAGKGTWNKQELAIPVYVKQAYYKSWWFILLSLLFITGLIYSLFRLRLYQVQQRRAELEREVKARTLELEREKKKSDDLLLNILPAETAEELKKHGKARAKRYEAVTVFFSDFVGFTHIATKMDPEILVAEIDKYFRKFDEIMDKHGLEKIKTIGDAYMCVGGIPTREKDNAVSVVKAALEIQQFMKQIAEIKEKDKEPYFESRIGIHTGPVVGGIVGIKKFAFDIWGDTVNIAARMEDNSEIGKVNISQTTFELVRDHFQCTYRGKITAKNKGDVDMYFVDGMSNHT